MILEADQPRLLEAAVAHVARLRPPASAASRTCATCGVGLFPEEAGPFCVPHAVEGHRVDNRGTVDELAHDDDVAAARALLGIGGRP